MNIPAWAFDASRIPDPTRRAARMLRFADILRHPRSTHPDKRLQLTSWQRRIVERIYGPSDEHGNRLARTVFILLPRGNRKTTLGAVIALGHTIGPEAVTAGQIISAASERSQARIAFDEAAEIIRLDGTLLRASRIRDTRNRIEHNRTRSVYSAISADGDAQHGKTPALVLADELPVCGRFRSGYPSSRESRARTRCNARDRNNPIHSESANGPHRATGSPDSPSLANG